MDYHRFLGKTDEKILPYFGGRTVDAEDRRLQVGLPFEPPGWYRFQIQGRHATMVESTDPPDLTALPKVTGWFHHGKLVRDGAVAETLWLIPGERPARFSKLTARRWPSGELLYGEADFESEVEGQLREAVVDGRSIKDVKAVPAPLRAAYAYALLEAASRRTGLRFAPPEVRGQVAAVAEGGAAEAERVLRSLEAEREQARREIAELNRRRAEALNQIELERQREAQREAARTYGERSVQRAELAMIAAGARFEDARELGGNQLEVIFRYLDHRFISIVEMGTLQVIDSGICLGHPPSDRMITLESLPAVIKEAIDTHRLVILRFP